METASILTLAERFAMIMQVAIQTVSVRWRAGNVPLSAIWRPALPHVVINLVCGRMLRARRLFDVLAARIRSGKVPAPRRRTGARRVVTRPDRPCPTPRAPDAFRVPRRVGWLISLAPEVGGYGGWLQQLLAEPEMAAVIAAHPAMARTLRPICRMLGIPAPDVPPSPPRPVASPSTRARPRTGSRPGFAGAPDHRRPSSSRHWEYEEARGSAALPSGSPTRW